MKVIQTAGLIALAISLTPASSFANDLPVDFAARAGFRIGGGGEQKVERTGQQNVEAEYDDTSGPIILAADVFFPIALNDQFILRVGGGLLLVPTVEVEFDSGADSDAGLETDLLGVAELLFPFNAQFAGFVRATFGLGILFAGGDLGDALDDACNNRNNCEVSGSPIISPVFGGGFGGAYKINPDLAVRAEFMWQHYSYTSIKIEQGNNTQEVSVSGDRFMLLGGVEF